MSRDPRVFIRQNVALPEMPTRLQLFAYNASRYLGWGPILCLLLGYLLIQLERPPVTFMVLWVPLVIDGLLRLIAFIPPGDEDFSSQHLWWLACWAYPLSFFAATWKDWQGADNLGFILLGWGGYFLLSYYLRNRGQYIGAALGLDPRAAVEDDSDDDDWEDDDEEEEAESERPRL